MLLYAQTPKSSSEVKSPFASEQCSIEYSCTIGESCRINIPMQVGTGGRVRMPYYISAIGATGRLKLLVLTGSSHFRFVTFGSVPAYLFHHSSQHPLVPPACI